MPSYFRRQGFCAVECDEELAGSVVQLIGDDQLVTTTGTTSGGCTPSSLSGARDGPPRTLRGEFAARFALRLARKDLGLAVDLGRAYGVPMRLSTLAEQELVEAMARGWGDRDASIAMTLQEERAGVAVRLP